MRSAIGHAHVQRHVLAMEHLCNGAFHGFHQLGCDTHLAVAAEDCEGSHVTGRIVRFVGPVREGGEMKIIKARSSCGDQTFSLARSRLCCLHQT